MNAPLDPIVFQDARGRWAAGFTHSPHSVSEGESVGSALMDLLLGGCSNGQLRVGWAHSPTVRPQNLNSDGGRVRPPCNYCQAEQRENFSDWKAVLSLAARHRVRPLLYESLAAGKLANVPASVMRELKDFTAANAHRNLLLVGKLLKLLDLLQSHGITAAPFKGPMLASSVYGSTALRESGDLDLLLRRRDIVRARRLLMQYGFQPAFPTADETEAAYLRSLTGRREIRYLTSHCEHHLVHPDGPVNVDLHWALALREFSLPLKEADLWSWLKPRQLNGRTVPGFEAEEMLLVLCINGAKDCWERLDRICDVAQLLRGGRDLNWQRVFEAAARVGGVRMVCLGLLLAADLLDAALPPAAIERVRADTALPRLRQHVQRRLFGEAYGEVEAAGAAKSIFHLAMRERLRDRIGYCLAHLEPTVGDWAAWPLPDGLRLLHYLSRPLRLAWQSCRGRPRR